MSDLVSQALNGLRRARVTLTAGLQDGEIAEIEAVFGFTFNAEHRELLQTALPTGDRWVDWRSASESDLRGRLDWPVDGVIFDVHHNGFWPSSWGRRPAAPDVAEAEARRHLEAVPRLVPIFSHRYLPAAPAPAPSPVFSVYQTDIIFYGDNLLDYVVAHEFTGAQRSPAGQSHREHVHFWSDLAEGAENIDL